MNRGYFGLALINTKTETNYGTLLRSALLFDCAFVIVAGKRFEKQASDTIKSHRHMPIIECSLDNLFEHVPYGCIPIAVECLDSARDLRTFSHPERAVYILGPEDGSIPEKVLKRCPIHIRIMTERSLNLAVAGSIVMYDRNNRR